MQDKYWYLKNCDLFDRLPSDQIESIEASSKIRTYESNSLVYLPNDRSDSVFLCASGRVKIYHLTSEGKQALLAIIEPGDVFGELAVFEGGTREDFAESMEKTSVIMIPGRTIQQLMESQPSVSLSISRLMGLRRQRVERRLKSLLFRSNRERLMHVLIELAEQFGTLTERGVELSIKLSHQDYANLIGSTRETVTVTLGKLQRDGYIRMNRRQIVITKITEIAEIVDLNVPERLLTPVRNRKSFPRNAPEYEKY